MASRDGSPLISRGPNPGELPFVGSTGRGLTSPMSEIVSIVPDRLYGLVHPYRLDGRVNSHPTDFDGWASMNCYLLNEPDRALLYNTGYSVHEAALLTQLEELVGDRPLGLALPRMEFASTCNARPVADRFNVDVAHQEMEIDINGFLNFRPTDHPSGADDGLRRVKQLRYNSPEVELRVDLAGRRCLEVVPTPLRLLPSDWVYDRETQTIFTNDVFSWFTRADEQGPWVEDTDSDDLDDSTAEASLFNCRYWWLPGSRVDEMRRTLESVFSTYPVQTIAPDHGAIIRGAAVQHNVDRLDRALARAGELESVGVAAGHWTMGSTR